MTSCAGPRTETNCNIIYFCIAVSFIFNSKLAVLYYIVVFNLIYFYYYSKMVLKIKNDYISIFFTLKFEYFYISLKFFFVFFLFVYL